MIKSIPRRRFLLSAGIAASSTALAIGAMGAGPMRQEDALGKSARRGAPKGHPVSWDNYERNPFRRAVGQPYSASEQARPAPAERSGRGIEEIVQ